MILIFVTIGFFVTTDIESYDYIWLLTAINMKKKEY